MPSEIQKFQSDLIESVKQMRRGPPRTHESGKDAPSCCRGPSRSAARASRLKPGPAWRGRMHHRIIVHPRRLAVLLLAATLAGGCTSAEIYNASQGWRQNECNKIGDSERRERCLKEEANRPYDAYSAASGARP